MSLSSVTMPPPWPPAGDAGSCGCAMCRPVSYLPQAAWSKPSVSWPIPKESMGPPPDGSAVERFRACVVAAIDAEADQIPLSSARAVLARLRGVVQTMEPAG